MSFMKLLENETNERDAKEVLDDLEFQMFRMRENIINIAKKWDVVGIEQTKKDEWTVISTYDDGNNCKIMLNDCQTSFKGNWDFLLEAEYKDENTIHIADIKGPADKGYGSVVMNYLKNIARQQNIQYITGDIVKRDWDHIGRLEHFYKKHYFDVIIDFEEKYGTIIWND
ncbi:hypothetical protein [Salirhabdus salicampi]|uniref:hypothetical protein n=1 Tax=Salirhabdus salicampi TaxID=476102 RepID=UPI0020C4E7DF|nr:hypothetical protein [Salirhabdus salicampi]MCP8616143.1 hypothetical protein [Salirhabdus salicampi]